VHRVAIIATILLGLVAFGAVALIGRLTVYETPKYRVTDRLGSIEIREYSPYLVAETIVDGSLETAGNQGFRILAKYIFGDNRVARKIPMTAPVAQEKAESTRIAMTTPVTQERAGDQYVIRFMMPSELSRDDLPIPNDERILIREMPARNLAAVRYSGRWSKRNYQKHAEELKSALRNAGLEPVGEPTWARYNPPFTPWFMRRNEILTEFRQADGPAY
jgi:hypothetical protein